MPLSTEGSRQGQEGREGLLFCEEFVSSRPLLAVVEGTVAWGPGFVPSFDSGFPSTYPLLGYTSCGFPMLVTILVFSLAAR